MLLTGFPKRLAHATWIGLTSAFDDFFPPPLPPAPTPEPAEVPAMIPAAPANCVRATHPSQMSAAQQVAFVALLDLLSRQEALVVDMARQICQDASNEGDNGTWP